MSVLAFASSTSVYDFTLNSIDGQPVALNSYKGKVLLLVNVASRCGYTPQYSALESVYEKYKDRGLVIIGFPANNFGAQEPGTNEEIKTFCTRKYNVSFPMMSKVSVKGGDQTPLYKYLTGMLRLRRSLSRGNGEGQSLGIWTSDLFWNWGGNPGPGAVRDLCDYDGVGHRLCFTRGGLARRKSHGER